MSNFAEAMSSAAQQAHAAKAVLNGRTRHQDAYAGLENLVDLMLFNASILMELASVLDADSSSSENAQERIAGWAWRSRHTMRKQVEVAREARDLVDSYRAAIGDKQVDPQARIDGHSEK